jgi:fibro-slime domain-containing protein
MSRKGSPLTATAHTGPIFPCQIYERRPQSRGRGAPAEKCPSAPTLGLQRRKLSCEWGGAGLGRVGCIASRAADSAILCFWVSSQLFWLGCSPTLEHAAPPPVKVTDRGQEEAGAPAKGDDEPAAPSVGADGGVPGGVNTEPEGEVLQDEHVPPCGNKVLDEGERCDDGNAKGEDGCAADCSAVEDGFLCRVVGEPCKFGQVCGDRRQTGTEQCDDWNSRGDDGCSATCQLEANFVCPTPGQACISSVVCGDDRVTGEEACDDGNALAGDGCDAACQLEAGWECLQVGFPCSPDCGDGLVLQREECDDGNVAAGDGCSGACKLEAGYACAAAGMPCALTVCGDSVVEGREACDDGDNVIVGDGCSPGCRLEPDCSLGACVSRCGDGLILPGDAETCDDGNSTSGDGCSESCQLEEGFGCSQVSDAELPDEVTLPVLYRDFIHAPEAVRHPDFQYFFGRDVTPGLVGAQLGDDGKPVYTGLCEEGNFVATDCADDAMTTTEANFAQWYQNTDGVNVPVLESLTFARQADGTYVFEVESGMFPLDDLGWVAEGSETATAGHNYGFTTELRSWFEYRGDEFLEFSGDDDVWVFIAGHLAVDIGGLHPSQTRSVTLDEATAARFGLEVGRVYEIALFHAERRTEESNFKLSLKGFAGASSRCEPVCGDGIVAGPEACDDGDMNGKGYGFCTLECAPGPRCGDEILDPDSPEQCDNGVNLDGYSVDGSGCAQGCVLPPFCGDGVVDSSFGEQCDLVDENDAEYGGCKADCTLAPRCGDGVRDSEFGEECDDGNVSSNDECDVECKRVTVGPAK